MGYSRTETDGDAYLIYPAWEKRGPDDHASDSCLMSLEFMDAIAPGERFVAGHLMGLPGAVVYRSGADGWTNDIAWCRTDDNKQYLPKPLVVHEDAEFLAALAPDEQDMREFIVAQSMDLLADFRRVIGPAVAIANHEFLQRLDQKYAFSFDVDTLPAPFPAPALFLTGRQLGCRDV
jgi:hypothetical protein